MKNRELLERIEVWQKKGMFNPLTCGNSSTHEYLQGIEEDNQIILVCPNKNCNYKQTYLPKFLFEKDFNKLLKY